MSLESTSRAQLSNRLFERTPKGVRARGATSPRAPVNANVRPQNHLTLHMTTSHPLAYYFGVIFGALAVGFLCGLVPAVAGGLTKQKRSAYVGFMSCLITGGIAGIFLAAPTALGFGILILVRWLRRPQTTDASRPAGLT